MQNSDAIVIMGSNFAECHPVGFRWAMKARERGAKLIHVDPRFTRTSAMCDVHVPIRSGSDIAFLGGIINYILSEDRWFKEYVLHYTNASTIVADTFQDTDELDGIFSGFDAEARHYDNRAWAYEGTLPGMPTQVKSADQPHAKEGQPGVDFKRFPPRTDPTLRHPRCVFQIVKRHYARYTPETVARICGCTEAQFLEVARTLCDNSGRERTSAFVYAVGWTQHTVGVQYIRAATLIQALLGNVGRPGGGILALRGHATIQGSTDIATLYNLLPGYLPAPSAQVPQHSTLEGWLENEMPTTGWWANGRKYMVSFLRAWYGDAARADNEWGYQYLPKNVGDHSHMPMFVAMHEGVLRGFMAIGQNPAVGGQNAVYQRAGLARLEWLVVKDLFVTETADFWKAPDVTDPSAIQTEVFFFPSSTTPEMDGSYTNTQRLVQWHEKGVASPGDCKSDLWFTHQLVKRLKRMYAGSTDPKDEPFQVLTWDFEEVDGEASALSVLKEINGYTLPDRKLVPTFGDLKDDGSTAAGAWIYTGIHPEDGVNLAASRVSDDYVALGWAFAWPANRRILYNRASADPAGKPWSDRKRYVWWEPARREWVGYDVPDFPSTKAPSAKGVWSRGGMDALDGDHPFIMKPDGKIWLYAPSGIIDGPLPTHYEPWEGPVANGLYKLHPRNPVAKTFNVVGNKYIDPGDPAFPIVVSTYRLTEHHLSGAMTRWLPWLAALMPELFIEISPELAQQRGIDNAGWVTVSTPRGAIECKALVTRRLRPFEVMGRTVHQVGMPFHWGYRGVVTGDVTNELAAMVADPNVTIHEAKVFMCQVESGRHAKAVLAGLGDAPRPMPHVGRRERQAAEANIDRAIALTAAATDPGQIVVEKPPFPFDQPVGVYHG
ncbi:MAG TPA: molybdopterin-dependent oxidoreductase [Gemmatimonadales bacterium]|nr:molybdopterin-dependent oxidoreductase [Gemmatimonadales bacterium]